MADKPLTEMTQDELDRTMRMTDIAGAVVTIGVLVALGYTVFDLLDGPLETQTSFTLIFVGFVLLGVFNLMVQISKQYLRIRRDLWDLMQQLGGG